MRGSLTKEVCLRGVLNVKGRTKGESSKWMLQKVIQQCYEEPDAIKELPVGLRERVYGLCKVYKKPVDYKSLWTIKESAEHEKNLWTRKKLCGP